MTKEFNNKLATFLTKELQLPSDVSITTTEHGTIRYAYNGIGFSSLEDMLNTINICNTDVLQQKLHCFESFASSLTDHHPQEVMHPQYAASIMSTISTLSQILDDIRGIIIKVQSSISNPDDTWDDPWLRSIGFTPQYTGDLWKRVLTNEYEIVFSNLHNDGYRLSLWYKGDSYPQCISPVRHTKGEILDTIQEFYAEFNKQKQS